MQEGAGDRAAFRASEARLQLFDAVFAFPRGIGCVQAHAREVIAASTRWPEHFEISNALSVAEADLQPESRSPKRSTRGDRPVDRSLAALPLHGHLHLHLRANRRSVGLRPQERQLYPLAPKARILEDRIEEVVSTRRAAKVDHDQNELDLFFRGP